MAFENLKVAEELSIDEQKQRLHALHDRIEEMSFDELKQKFHGVVEYIMGLGSK